MNCCDKRCLGTKHLRVQPCSNEQLGQPLRLVPEINRPDQSGFLAEISRAEIDPAKIQPRPSEVMSFEICLAGIRIHKVFGPLLGE